VKLGVTQLGRGEEGLEVDLDAVEGGGAQDAFYLGLGRRFEGEGQS
jgi:hypothetical protein